jgi:hypothetical protein
VTSELFHFQPANLAHTQPSKRSWTEPCSRKGEKDLTDKVVCFNEKKNTQTKMAWDEWGEVILGRQGSGVTQERVLRGTMRKMELC